MSLVVVVVVAVVVVVVVDVVVVFVVVVLVVVVVAVIVVVVVVVHSLAQNFSNLFNTDSFFSAYTELCYVTVKWPTLALLSSPIVVTEITHIIITIPIGVDLRAAWARTPNN